MDYSKLMAKINNIEKLKVSHIEILEAYYAHHKNDIDSLIKLENNYGAQIDFKTDRYEIIKDYIENNHVDKNF